jgi:hypothetical protein
MSQLVDELYASNLTDRERTLLEEIVGHMPAHEPAMERVGAASGHQVGNRSLSRIGYRNQGMSAACVSTMLPANWPTTTDLAEVLEAVVTMTALDHAYLGCLPRGSVNHERGCTACIAVLAVERYRAIEEPEGGKG